MRAQAHRDGSPQAVLRERAERIAQGVQGVCCADCLRHFILLLNCEVLDMHLCRPNLSREVVKLNDSHNMHVHSYNTCNTRYAGA